MKILVLENDSKISQIYQKIFNEKKVAADLVKNESEFLKKANEGYDYLILEKPISEQNDFLELENTRDFDRNFLFLSSVIPKNNNSSHMRNETRDLLEKPFAMITLLTKLELSLKKEALTA